MEHSPSVRHDPGQVRGYVNRDDVCNSLTGKRLSCLFHQVFQVRGFGSDRQRPRLDLRHIDEVVDQMAHMVGLLIDNPEELAGLGGVQRIGGAEHGCRRALDGAQRRPQLVAHHAEEIRELPLRLLQRCYVLHGGHHGNRLAVVPVDRPGVDEGGDRPSVRQVDHDLIGEHRLAASQRLGGGKLIERNIAPIHSPEGHHLKELFHRGSPRVQPAYDPSGLIIRRHQVSRLRIEDQNAYRRDVDQGLQVGSGLSLRPVNSGRWRWPLPLGRQTGPGCPHLRG